MCKIHSVDIYAVCKNKCAKFETDRCANTQLRSIVKCMAFGGASTLCENLTSVQIIEVCKLTGLLYYASLEASREFNY